MSSGSESGTTPLWPSPQRIVSHSANSPSFLPRKMWLSPGISPVRNEPPILSSSPVEQKKNDWVVNNCLGVHMLALIIVFCFKKSATVKILRSNLNLSASIQVEPKYRFVLSNLAFAGPMYLDRGSALAISVSGNSSHGPLLGRYSRNDSCANSSICAVDTASSTSSINLT